MLRWALIFLVVALIAGGWDVSAGSDICPDRLDIVCRVFDFGRRFDGRGPKQRAAGVTRVPVKGTAA